MKQRQTIGYKVGFVSCCKTKRKGFFKAKDLYISDLFKKSFSFCHANYDFVYILSAKYGLLKPDDYIEDYDMSLNSFTSEERQTWSDNVYIKILENTSELDTFYWHCGYNYRCFLIKKLNNINIVPLDCMGIGKQLSFYKTTINTYNDLF